MNNTCIYDICYIHICIYIYMYICIYIYVYMYIYMYIYIYTLYVIEYKSRGLTANIFSSIHFENRQERGGLT